MFFQDVTPDTSGYMIAGYVVAFLVMGLYVASMYLRSRNLKQDISMLEEMEQPASGMATAETKSESKPSLAKTAQTVTKTHAEK